MKTSTQFTVALLSLMAASGLSQATQEFKPERDKPTPQHVVVTPRRHVTVLPHKPTVEPQRPAEVRRMTPPAR